MKNKILIGTLASHFGISKQTLIHYDRIGLLKPSATAGNGYRYYTFEDIDKLDVIVSLKDTGLSLDAIQEYQKKPSIEDSIILLKQQTTLLEEHIKHLERTKNKITNKVVELEYLNSFDWYSGVKVIEKKERYVLKEAIDTNSENEFEVAFAIKDLNTFVSGNSNYAHYSHSIEGVTVNHKEFNNDNYADLNSTFIFIKNYSGHEKESILSAGIYVCILHYGLYEKTHESYAPLIDFINKNHYKIIGDSVEIPLITAWAAKVEKDYVTEIQIPVRKIK